jgi:hypothetical protein
MTLTHKNSVEKPVNRTSHAIPTQKLYLDTPDYMLLLYLFRKCTVLFRVDIKQGGLGIRAAVLIGLVVFYIILFGRVGQGWAR